MTIIFMGYRMKQIKLCATIYMKNVLFSSAAAAVVYAAVVD